MYPEVNFQLSQKIDNKDWDFRISTVTPGQNGIKSEEISHTVLREEIFLAVPVASPYDVSGEISLKQAATAPFICHDKSKPLTLLTTGYCMQCGFLPDVVLKATTLPSCGI